MHEAFKVATTGRPWPVLVDIPKDIQFQKAAYTKPKKEKKLNGKHHKRFNQKDIEELIKLMSKSNKPIFYTGGGVINSGPKASMLLREVVQAVPTKFWRYRTQRERLKIDHHQHQVPDPLIVSIQKVQLLY